MATHPLVMQLARPTTEMAEGGDRRSLSPCLQLAEMESCRVPHCLALGLGLWLQVAPMWITCAKSWRSGSYQVAPRCQT